MTKTRSIGGEFSKREIVLFVLAMLVATFLTIEGTHYVLRTFVLGHPGDPLEKTSGLSREQQEMQNGK
jgi:hypothetical protein